MSDTLYSDTSYLDTSYSDTFTHSPTVYGLQWVCVWMDVWVYGCMGV
jgi:hypothetical protein